MCVTYGDENSPFSKKLDIELDIAVRDQVIDSYQSQELKDRIRKVTAWRVDVERMKGEK